MPPAKFQLGSIGGVFLADGFLGFSGRIGNVVLANAVRRGVFWWWADARTAKQTKRHQGARRESRKSTDRARPNRADDPDSRTAGSVERDHAGGMGGPLARPESLTHQPTPQRASRRLRRAARVTLAPDLAMAILKGYVGSRLAVRSWLPRCDVRFAAGLVRFSQQRSCWKVLQFVRS